MNTDTTPSSASQCLNMERSDEAGLVRLERQDTRKNHNPGVCYCI